MKIYSKIDNKIKIGEIIKSKDLRLGTNFFTENNDYLQVGSVVNSEEFIVKPHFHTKNKRLIEKTQEVWILIKGKLNISFFDIDNSLLFSDIINDGDISILYNGGHSMKKKSKQMILYEVKNGPFNFSFDDKTNI